MQRLTFYGEGLNLGGFKLGVVINKISLLTALQAIPLVFFKSLSNPTTLQLV